MQVHEHACAAILMYLPDTTTHDPHNCLHISVANAASASHVTQDQLFLWSSRIRQDYVMKNLPALPLKVVEDMDPVLARRISVRQETFMSFLENQSK